MSSRGIHNDEKNAFRHRTVFVPRFGDIDAVGHVNNARYSSYLEEARVSYAKEVLGWNGILDSLNIVVADLHLEFKNPIFLQDEVLILSRVSEVGGRSFTFRYLIYALRDGQEVLAARASTALVYFDYRSGRSARIPDDWRSAISAYEDSAPE
jgi:acyl-CoA thioester hydrolase